MLATLKKYEEPQPALEGFQSIVQRWYRINRRFAGLFVLSLIFHLSFGLLLLKLDLLYSQHWRGEHNTRVSLVKLADLASGEEPAFEFRSIPEALERADLSNLQFDPETADDRHLIARSPTPGEGKRSDSRIALDRRPLARGDRRGALVQPSAVSENRVPEPPPSLSVNPIRLPAVTPKHAVPDIPANANPGRFDPPAGVPGSPDGTLSAPPGGTRADLGDAAALGFQAAQAQYMAYVRSKISRINERHMPRDWIRDMLTRRVSLDYEVVLRQGGHIQSTRLLRPSGYRVLDEKAREAIYMAQPFEGWPRIAGDNIILTVTVYYAPIW